MSTKLNLAATVEKFRKGVNSRNTRLTEGSIAKVITNQKEVLEKKIKTLKEDLEESKGDFDVDFSTNLVATLANAEEGSVKDSSSRKAFADKYVANACAAIKEREEEIEKVTATIAEKEAKLVALGKLETRLSELDIETEGKED